MTDAPSLGMLIAGVVTTLGLSVITTFGTIILNKLNRADEKNGEIKTTVAETKVAVAEVHNLTNSNLTALNARLDKVLAENAELRRSEANKNPPEQNKEV